MAEAEQKKSESSFLIKVDKIRDPKNKDPNN